MTWIDIVWPVMGGTSLALGLIHLLIWSRQREAYPHLLLSLSAAVVGVLAIYELLGMRADTPQHYAEMLRSAHVLFAMLIVLLAMFVHQRFRSRRVWLGVLACILRVGALLPNFLTGVNLNFSTIERLDQVKVWGGDTIVVPVGQPNLWTLVGQLSNLLLVIFILDTMIAVWRRGDAEARRRAVLVCASLALFIALPSVWGALVIFGKLHAPMTMNFAFIGVILVLSYELSMDVLHADKLARSLTVSEASLRESEQRVRGAVSGGGLGLWTWDLGRNESWFTGLGYDLLGLAPGESVSWERVLEQAEPEFRAALQQARADALRTGDYACEFRLRKADGSSRWVLAKGSRATGSPDSSMMMRGVLLDITDRRQAEDRFRLIVETAPQAMLAVDHAGLITLANSKAEQLFGYSRAELVGMNVDMFVATRIRPGHARDRADFAARPDVRAMAAGRQVLASCRDGRQVPVEIGLTPIQVADQDLVIASIVDISDRLRAEQEARLQNAELAHLSRVSILGELSGSLAHELNQPLAAILSNAQAGLRFLEHSPPNLGEVRESLIHIADSDKRAGEVIRRLRAMLRKDQIEHQPLQANELVQDALGLLHSDLLNRKVTVLLELGTDLPEISGDPVQLKQVFINLVINGCDAMSESDRAHVLTVSSKAVAGNAVEISVGDTGAGVPAEDMERIFEPFVTSKSEGIGLGLAICRSIIHAHGGQLWARNNDAYGATLHVVLPARPGSPEPQP